jgi:predicted NBD/HSP70 family sugar kinase
MLASEQALNRLKILKAIRRHAPLSRSDLLARTGLSWGTNSQAAADLIRRGLIVETKDPTKRLTGRPRTILEINAAANVVVGVALTGGMLQTAFVNLAGTKLFERDVPLRYPATLGEFATEIASALAAAVHDSPFSNAEISRVGMAMPAIVDSNRGIVHSIATFPPEPVPFAAIVGGKLGLPITIENDVVCMARAEQWFGRAGELDTFTIVYLGLLVGSAEYVGGLPRVGKNGFNAELGHVKTAVGRHAPPCYCGARGCLAAFASMYGMACAMGMLPELTGESLAALGVKVHHVLDLAEAKDRKAIAVVQRAADHLGAAVANHLNAADPGTVFILTANRRLRDALVDRTLAAIEQNTLPGILPQTDIVFEAADKEWRWKGTAALALEKLYLEEDAPQPQAADRSISVE